MDIRAGQIVLFYLFDVANTIDLQVISRLIGGATAAKLSAEAGDAPVRPVRQAAVVVRRGGCGSPEVDGFKARIRLYDYGVVSIALTRPFSGSWSDLVGLGQTLIESDELEQRAEAMCQTIVERTRAALIGLRATYSKRTTSSTWCTSSTAPTPPNNCSPSAATNRGDAARRAAETERSGEGDDSPSPDLIPGRRPRHPDVERRVRLRHTGRRASGARDRRVRQFTAARYRYYDERLDDELASIYARLQQPGWFDQWRGSRYTRAARQVHSLFIEFNEVTDRTENALKFIGDIYAARLFWLVAERLGLSTWKADIETKLKTLDDIYRFAVEQGRCRAASSSS